MAQRDVEFLQFQRVPHERLYERMLEQIRDLLARGSLKPGDRLPPERELAAATGLSRASLREAFRVLEVQGILVSKPGGGRFIRASTPSGEADGAAAQGVIDALQRAAVLDFLEAREVIEPRIAVLAVQRADSADLAALEQAVDMRRDLNTSFHLALARASHNVVFYQSMRLYLQLLRHVRARTMEEQEAARAMHREHEAIYRGVRRRDADAAARAVEVHLGAVRERGYF